MGMLRIILIDHARAVLAPCPIAVADRGHNEILPQKRVQEPPSLLACSNQRERGLPDGVTPITDERESHGRQQPPPDKGPT